MGILRKALLCLFLLLFIFSCIASLDTLRKLFQIIYNRCKEKLWETLTSNARKRFFLKWKYFKFPFGKIEIEEKTFPWFIDANCAIKIQFHLIKSSFFAHCSVNSVSWGSAGPYCNATLWYWTRARGPRWSSVHGAVVPRKRRKTFIQVFVHLVKI